MNVDISAIKPYGDALNDGKVQVSFTLPLESGLEAKEACRELANKMGLKEVDVVHMKDLGEGFSFFILYGKAIHTIDATQIKVAQANTITMSFSEINEYIKNKIERKLTVVGACTGSDAHTVGLDAIMNMKGYAGEYGLERYPQIDAHNLGSQVSNEKLIKTSLDVEADAILVSKVVTQKGVHIKDLTELVELLEAEELREKFILVVGGPRISHELALELGFDAGFGFDTVPPQVATYIAKKVAGEI